MSATVKRTSKSAPRRDAQPIFLIFAVGFVIVGLAIFLVTSNGGLGSGDAPQFTATTLYGDPIQLSDFRGQVVMLNFWATWCPPCRAEMPSIESAYERYRDEGFVVLAINNGEQPADIAAFTNALSLRFPVLLDTDRRLQDVFNITGYPTSLFLGRDGKPYATHVGGLNATQLADYIETGLAQQAPTT